MIQPETIVESGVTFYRAHNSKNHTMDIVGVLEDKVAVRSIPLEDIYPIADSASLDTLLDTHMRDIISELKEKSV